MIVITYDSDNIYLKENGIIITDPKQVANQFNNYFVTVAEKLTKKLVNQITNTKTILKIQMNTVCTLLKLSLMKLKHK